MKLYMTQQLRSPRFFSAMTVIRAVVVVLLYGGIVSEAHANLLTSTDLVPITQLKQQLLQLLRDMNSAANTGGSQIQECLINMQDDVKEIYDNIQRLDELSSISTKMQLEFDEKIVNDTLRLDISSVKKSLTLLRESINLSAGYCGQYSLVSQKAQEALELFAQANNIIDALEIRLGQRR